MAPACSHALPPRCRRLDSGRPRTPAVNRTGSARAFLGALIVAAVVGVAAFGTLAWRAVTVVHVDTPGALQAFEEARMRVPMTTPLVERDAAGTFVRRQTVIAPGPAPTALHALAYYVDGQRLVRADVPLWFAKMKGPALRYAVRDTRLDLDALNLTATDLEDAGAGVVLDETRANGDRLLVWTD